ncbi:hypothetical protein RJG79_10780 [Mycoplasmatota bacterium WC44]
MSKRTARVITLNECVELVKPVDPEASRKKIETFEKYLKEIFGINILQKDLFKNDIDEFKKEYIKLYKLYNESKENDKNLFKPFHNIKRNGLNNIDYNSVDFEINDLAGSLAKNSGTNMIICNSISTHIMSEVLKATKLLNGYREGLILFFDKKKNLALAEIEFKVIKLLKDDSPIFEKIVNSDNFDLNDQSSLIKTLPLKNIPISLALFILFRFNKLLITLNETMNSQKSFILKLTKEVPTNEFVKLFGKNKLKEDTYNKVLARINGIIRELKTSKSNVSGIVELIIKIYYFDIKTAFSSSTINEKFIKSEVRRVQKYVKNHFNDFKDNNRDIVNMYKDDELLLKAFIFLYMFKDRFIRASVNKDSSELLYSYERSNSYNKILKKDRSKLTPEELRYLRDDFNRLAIMFRLPNGGLEKVIAMEQKTNNYLITEYKRIIKEINDDFKRKDLDYKNIVVFDEETFEVDIKLDDRVIDSIREITKD